MQSSDDETFTRRFWEVNSDTIGKRWFGFAKGGSFSRYYDDLNLLINWEENGRDIKAFISNIETSVSRQIRSESYYYLEGITYPNSSSRAFSARYLPENHIFSVKGQGIFFKSHDDIWWNLAILNSSFFDALLHMLNPSKDYQAGQIKVLPAKPLTEEQKNFFRLLAQNAYNTKARWDTGNEISTRFRSPWLLEVLRNVRGDSANLSTALDTVEKQEQELDVCLQSLQLQINEAVYQLYDISAQDQALIERVMSKRPPELVWPQMEGKSRAEKRKEHVRRLLSYFVLEEIRRDADGITECVNHIETALTEVTGASMRASRWNHILTNAHSSGCPPPGAAD